MTGDTQMQTMKTKFVTIFALTTTLMIYGCLQTVKAATVYDMLITTGSINTSGGITGTGIGMLAAGGTFRATITDTSIQFTDLNVSTNPPSSFVFPDYAGSFDGFYFSGIQNVPGFGQNSYSGSFDGSVLHITGEYSDPFADGIQFSFNISSTATWVPVPGSLVLLLGGLSLVGITGIKRGTH
jgi:hypothetical protein